MSTSVPATRPPIRLGLLADAGPQPWWVAELLRELIGDGTVELVLVVRADAPPPDPRERPTWRRRVRYGLYGLHERLDRRLYGDGFDPLQPVPIDYLVAGSTVLDVVPVRTRFSDRLSPADVDRIREARCDVLLRTGFRILRGEVLGAAKHGVWSYHHGDNQVNRGGPPGFWESMRNDPVTGATLQVLTEALDGGRAIGRAWCATDPRSPLRNRRALYRQAMALLPKALRTLRDGGPEDLASLATDSTWSGYSYPLSRMPTCRQMLSLLGARLGRSIASRWRSLWRTERWELALLRHPHDAASPRAPDGVLSRSRLVPCALDRYWADPFVARAGDGWVVFCEELLKTTGRGRIVAMEVAADGTVGPSRPVLEAAHHLSYPCVFEHEGTWYMIPETFDAHRVELHRSTAFPWEWKLEATLLDNVALVDATLHHHDGRWWLFGGMGAHRGSASAQLHLFSAPALTGPWVPHPENPVCADVRRARPAGRLFTQGGRLFRPGQDCAKSYGGAIVMHEVLRLDEARYVETVIDRLDPLWRPDLRGLHTINADRGLTAIDVRRRRWRWGR